jgi:hypothetical protein
MHACSAIDCRIRLPNRCLLICFWHDVQLMGHYADLEGGGQAAAQVRDNDRRNYDD